jgi:hypothetical protein
MRKIAFDRFDAASVQNFRDYVSNLKIFFIPGSWPQQPVYKKQADGQAFIPEL